MNEFNTIDLCILTLDEKSFTKLLLYGDSRYDSKINNSIILASINFIYSVKCFDGHFCLQYLLSSDNKAMTLHTVSPLLTLLFVTFSKKKLN